MMSGFVLGLLCVVMGQRPYEMVWADRTQDEHPAFLSFEDLSGWTVETKDAVVDISLTREQQLWGDSVAKVTYQGTGVSPSFTLKPERSMPVKEPFDCINFWVYGNNWAFSPDRSTPQVRIMIQFKGEDGADLEVGMGAVRWKEWWLMHKKLNRTERESLGENPLFEGIRVVGCTNEEKRSIYLDNLSLYREELKPLHFDPRPKRNCALFEGQSRGVHTGSDTLPFPTREETILPTNLVEESENRLTQKGEEYLFTYKGLDGILEYRYGPATGTLSDLSLEWKGRGKPFQPLFGGGVLFAQEGQDAGVEASRRKLLDCSKRGNEVWARWQLEHGKRDVEVTYVFRLWGKSLVVDVLSEGGEIAEFRIGSAKGASNPGLCWLPYLSFKGTRPHVLVTGALKEPLFLTAFLDWYRSNASQLYAKTEIQREWVTYNGGSWYRHKTDGTRNPCFERLFLTVSPCFEEVLPNIPNPKSPWMHVTGERLWRAHGASHRKADYAFWKNIARHGMTQVVITDHETGWRDGGESFTFRTRAAPGKGGDEGQAWYAREIQKLGFYYGIYNNYTDYAPVNEHWDEDCVTRTSEGQWRTAWPRCYNPKPTRAVEFESRLAPIIEDKFHLSTAYCDVHTAVSPWDYCDYDARVPGAGTFAATFYAYGEIMLHQKKIWDGPVYSEGGQHWYYCGLTDGNYGQDSQAQLPNSPWLVDFDLLKLHPLCCNFGMGNLQMFFGKNAHLGRTVEERAASLDRFLAASIAFGHTGFLVTQGGMDHTVRSYFMLQQLHKQYAQEMPIEIRYANEEGTWLSTSDAVANEAYKRSQVATRYSNGLLTVVNGHPLDDLACSLAGLDLILPPNGYLGVLREKGREAPLLYVLSGRFEGHRCDYAETAAYLFGDGRGRLVRFPKMLCDGALIALKGNAGGLELIPLKSCTRYAMDMGGQTAVAVALNEEGERLGATPARFSRDLIFVEPMRDAFSYRLIPSGQPKRILRCERVKVVPGETVLIRGEKEHPWTVPPDASAGDILWVNAEDAYLHFQVVPLTDAELLFENDQLRVKMTSNLDVPEKGYLRINDVRMPLTLEPEEATDFQTPVTVPKEEGLHPISLRVELGSLQQQETYWVLTQRAVRDLVFLPQRFEAGERKRGGDEGGFDPLSGANAYRDALICSGKEKRGIAMHPPWKDGVGYTYALLDEISLPMKPAAAFRAYVGKRDGSQLGDGILYRVFVRTGEEETLLAEKHVSGHEWVELEGDLTPWAGRSIRLKLVADVGSQDNSSGDWAAWAEMRIETRDPQWNHTVQKLRTGQEHIQGPYPVEGLTLSELRRAKKAWLHAEGMGVEGAGQYKLDVEMNGFPLGKFPTARGNEAEEQWSDPISMELPPKLIQTLGPRNLLAIHNPGRDFLKLRRFWIEWEWVDGQKGCSLIHKEVHSQPPTWRYAEGNCVPFGDAIQAEIRIPFER